jgi:hypothetical protein
VIPVIIRVNGTTQKSLRICMNNVTGKHEIKELKKKSALSDAAPRLRTVLM